MFSALFDLKRCNVNNCYWTKIIGIKNLLCKKWYIRVKGAAHLPGRLTFVEIQILVALFKRISWECKLNISTRLPTHQPEGVL